MPAELQLGVSIDQNKIFNDVISTFQRIPVQRIKVDATGLGVISRQATEFQRSLQAASARVLAFTATAGQVYAVARGFDALLKSTIEVQHQLANINVIFGLSSRQLNEFSTGLFKIANETGQSFKVTAEAALVLVRQGLSVSETLKRTRDALTLTRFTGLDAAESIRVFTAAINGFNEVALDSTAILNKLATVETSFAVTGRDVAESLTRVSSIAKDSGVSFDKLIGLITSARVITGREGAIISTALGTIFQRIQRPEVIDQLEKLGVATQTASGEALSADEVLKNLAQTYNTLSNSQKAQVTQLAGGVRQGNILRALLQDLASQNSIFARATLSSANATDIATKRQSELNKTLSSQINATVNNLTQAAAKVGTLTLQPAVERVLGVGNFVAGAFNKDLSITGSDSGSVFAQGFLKGIGNYLSGPGLGLGAALIGKIFVNFATFAVKSLSQIVEGTSARFQQEQAIVRLLEREPGLLQELLALNGNQLEIQARITQELSKQLILQNQQAAIRNAVIGNLGTGAGKQFFINQKEEIALNPKFSKAAGFVPAATEMYGALRGGYLPGDIKEMNIPSVGRVVYNGAEKVVKFAGFAEPAILPPQGSIAGKNYASSFKSTHGFNPYSATGFIPAAGGLFGGTLGISQEGQISRLQLNSLNEEISQYAFLIQSGLSNQKTLNSSTILLANKFNLTQDAMDKLANYFKSLSSQKPPLLLTDKTGPFYSQLFQQQNKSPFLDEFGNKRRVITPPFPPFEEDRQKQRILGDFTSLNYQNTRAILGRTPDLSILNSLSLYKSLSGGKSTDQFIAEKIEKSFSKLNVFDLFLTTPRYRQAAKSAEENDQFATLRNFKTNQANNALIGSFIAPIIAASIQQAILSSTGGTSRGSRGAAATVGGLGNILSFGLTGLGISGGNPVGGLVGAGLGAVVELPGIIKAFSDTLPDLERHLDELKETTSKTSEALQEYVDVSSKLVDARNGDIDATNRDVEILNQRKSLAAINIPQNIRSQIDTLQSKGKFAEAGQAASNFGNTLKQNLNFQVDTVSLKKFLSQNNVSSTLGSESTLQSNLLKTFLGLDDQFSSAADQLGESERRLEIFKGNLGLNQQIKPFVQSFLSLENQQGKSLLSTLTKEDIANILSAKNSGFESTVKTLTSLLGQKGFSGQFTTQFGDDLRDLFGEDVDSQKLFLQDVGKTFSQTNISTVSDQNKSLIEGSKLIDKAFSDFTKNLIRYSDKFNDFNIRIEQNANNSFNLKAGQLRSSEIVEKASNQISLLRAGGNPNLAISFNLQEEQKKAQDTLELSLQQTNNKAVESIGKIIGDVSTFLPEKIQANLSQKKSSKSISVTDYEDAQTQLDIITKFFNSKELQGFREILSNPSSVKEKDFNNIKDYFNNEIDLLSKFSQIDAFNSDKVKSLAPKLGLSPEEAEKIFLNRNELLNAFLSGLNKLEETLVSRQNETKAAKSAKLTDITAQTEADQQRRLLQYQFAFSSDQQNQLRKSIEDRARGGNFGSLNSAENIGQEVFSGFQYNSKQFFNDLHQQVSEFGTEFKGVFEKSFDAALTSSEKFSTILRQNATEAAAKVAGGFINSGLNATFGLLASRLPGGLGSLGNIIGTALPRFSQGGYVGMGSGTKDDVPAFLSGGEFVLNKKAVNSIGKENLDVLNFGSSKKFAIGGLNPYIQPLKYKESQGQHPALFPAATTVSSETTTGTSANIDLANALLAGVGDPRIKGKLDVDPLLSIYGQTEESNPQNVLKFARQKFLFNRQLSNLSTETARSNFFKNQDISLGIGLGTAALRFAIPSLLNSSKNSLFPGTAGASLNPSAGAPLTSNLFPGTSNIQLPSSSDLNLQASSLFYNPQAKGGYIRRFGYGGYFGGDSSSDRPAAIVMGGEYVMSPSKVNQYGVGFFDNLNKKYAAGGYVTNSTSGGQSNEISSYLSKLVDLNQQISDKLSSSNQPLGNKATPNTPNQTPGGGITNTVSVSVTITNSAGSSSTSNSSVNANSTSSDTSDKQTGAQLGQLMQQAALQVINQANKPGGILYERYQLRR